MYLIDLIHLILPPLMFFLWILAIAVYAAKLVFPKWDEFTRFGKLEVKQAWNGFRLTLPNRVGWICFYLFSCIMFFVSFILVFPPGPANWLLIGHSARRVVESLYVTRFSPREMHAVNLCAGLGFYGMTALTLAECSTGMTLGHVAFGIIALVLNVVQFRVHSILASLPKWSVPKDVLFTLVASPHYTSEIALYFVYFLCGPSVLSGLMFAFVVVNLSHQATMTYKWYEEKFGTQFTSEGRYVLIPWIY